MREKGNTLLKSNAHCTNYWTNLSFQLTETGVVWDLELNNLTAVVELETKQKMCWNKRAIIILWYKK